jgi:SAM-dependent methyltransferase
MYVQYGCGLSAPLQWINYDVSPTLRIQKIAILGTILKPLLNVQFPKNVLYGDIIKGLPIEDETASGIYCSHTLEHLSLIDLRIALRNTHRVLKSGGIFRLVLPDIEFLAKEYLQNLECGILDSNSIFLENSMLGLQTRPRGIKAFLSSFYGNSNHLWMWDYLSLSTELKSAGFQEIRRCAFGDSDDKMFALVEDEGRFINCLSIECRKIK